MLKPFRAALVAAVALAGGWATGATGAQAAVTAATPGGSVLFVVDTSGSMLGTPLAQAKTALTTSFDALPATTASGLRHYGGNCGDGGRLLVPIDTGAAHRTALDTAVSQLVAGGNTPTPDALRAAAADLPASGKRTIVLVSDGMSTCGDPCPVAKQLSNSGIDFTVHTVGFNAPTSAAAELKCIADATGGQYVAATDGPGLTSAIGAVLNTQPLRYVALGDSYSSGEGAGDYFQTKPRRNSRHTVDNPCHRSRKAWSFGVSRLAANIPDWTPTAPSADVENAACSGAKINDVTRNRFKGEQAQVKRLQELNRKAPVDLVTITIGGNDLGFSTIIADCFFKPIACDRGRLRDTGANPRDGIGQEALRIEKQVIPALKSAAPSAKIVLVGYPRVLPTSAHLVRCGRFTDSERRAVNAYVANINKAWAQAAAKAGAEFVAVDDALNGHELCTTDSHVQKIYGNPSNSQQGHPNAEGQDDLAVAVQAGLKGLGITR